MPTIPIIQVGDVIVSTDILTEHFCCDLAQCHGQCCVEGDAGAPLLTEEVLQMEAVLPAIEDELTPEARTVIAQQGVAYVDRTGELVTGIVAGRDCIFARHEDGCCLCASERAYRAGRTAWSKPLSCSLYPIREKRFSGGLTGLNLHRWDICAPARRKGRELGLPVYRFLRDALVRRFGETWYEELESVAAELRRQGMV
ncbi:MAG: DUF3109 family protein [Alloprevotella sp.]|nr:DUF3109 family protein [Alloprevotella sp.]